MKTRKKQLPPCLLRLWDKEWERWRATEPGASHDEPEGWSLETTGTTPESLIEANCHFVLPARAVCSVPLWTPAGSESDVQESAHLQMEVSGIVNSQTTASQTDFQVLRREENRVLVRGMLFPQDFSLPVRPDYVAFLPSPLAVRLPADSLCLWKEGSQVVACLTCGEDPLVWESAPEPEGRAELQGWIEALFVELRASDFPVNPGRCVDYAKVIGSERFLGLPVEEAPPPPPALPTRIPSWAPPAVLTARDQVLVREKIRQFATGAGSALLIMAIIIAGWLLYLELQLRGLRAEVAQLEEEAAPAIAIARQWEVLERTIDPKHFALEQLLFAVNALPPEGVRLSLFEALPDSVRIEGDARNVGLATLYFNALQTGEAGAMYSWTMPSPVLQPDNTARFAIDGKRLP